MTQGNEGADRNAGAPAERQQEAVAVQPRQPVPEAPPSDRHQRSYWHKPKNWVSLLTLIAVSVYTGITAMLWCNSNRQIAISRDSEQRQLRAYVDIDAGSEGSCGFAPIPNSNPAQQNAVCRFTIKNFGLTPADDVSWQARTAIREFPLGTKPLSPPTRNPVPIRLPPSGHVIVNIPAEEGIVTSEQMTAWDGENAAIYTYGTIAFADVFGRQCRIKFEMVEPKSAGQQLSFVEGGNAITCSSQQ